MLDGLDPNTLRRVFDLLAKTSMPTGAVAAATGVPEYLVLGILSGHCYGRERSDYGGRRLGIAAELRGVELHPKFSPPRYSPRNPNDLPDYVFKDFRELIRRPPANVSPQRLSPKVLR